MKHLHIDTPVAVYKAVSFLHLTLFTCAGEDFFFFFLIQGLAVNWVDNGIADGFYT